MNNFAFLNTAICNRLYDAILMNIMLVIPISNILEILSLIACLFSEIFPLC